MAFYNRTIDTALMVEDGNGAMTDGSLASTIVDLGGDTVKGTATTVRMWCAVEMLVSALNFDQQTECYDIYVVGSNTAACNSGVAILGHLHLGDATTHASGVTGLVDQTSTGRYLIPFVNEKAGTVYRYIALWLQATGSSPSITAKAWLTKLNDYPI